MMIQYILNKRNYILFFFAICIILKAIPSLGQNNIDYCSADRDIVFIIDQSGSMLENDPYRWRWDILNYAINYLNSTTDRVAIIPFGGNLETLDYARRSQPGINRTKWFNLDNYADSLSLKRIINEWFRHKEMKHHSKTTNILSAFEYLETQIDQPQEQRDMYIFFISDGTVDLYSPDRPGEDNLINQHNIKLLKLLERHTNRWRLYNICLGSSRKLNVTIHKKMLNKISIKTRISGASFPGFADNEANYPFLLLANCKNKKANLLKMKQGIGHVLDRGSSLEKISEITHTNNSFVIPGRGSASLRLKFTVFPKISADEFQLRLYVNFVLSGIYHRVNMDLITSEDRLLASYFDFAVDESSVESVLERSGRNIKDIKSWQIGVETSGLQFEVLNLEVSYSHGWNFLLDTLQVVQVPMKRRGFFRWLFDNPEPCDPILQIHAIAENQCGSLLSDSSAILKIINGREYQINVRKLPGKPSVKERYELWKNIADKSFFSNKLGEKVEVEVSFAKEQYIFKTNTVPVRVCAKYSDLNQ